MASTEPNRKGKDMSEEKKPYRAQLEREGKIGTASNMDPWLSGQPRLFNCYDGQTLRMVPTADGCILILELPRTHFWAKNPMIGYKMANGSEMFFEYRLTTHGKALFEWLPSLSGRLAGQDQPVLWLGGPMPSLGGL